MLDIAKYKLTDLLSSAGATIGIIIAGTIFLQFMNTQFIQLGGRCRDLTKEYRSTKGDVARHPRLQAQIRIYRRRLRLIAWASWLGSLALLSFLISVLAGGFSMLYPPVEAIRAVGTISLFLGLVLIGGAVALELAESILSRHELDEEVGDLDDDAKRIY